MMNDEDVKRFNAMRDHDNSFPFGAEPSNVIPLPSRRGRRSALGPMWKTPLDSGCLPGAVLSPADVEDVTVALFVALSSMTQSSRKPAFAALYLRLTGKEWNAR